MTIPEYTPDFARTFQEYLDCFVVIGGTPTAAYLEQRGGKPKATIDLDIIILEMGKSERTKNCHESLRCN